MAEDKIYAPNHYTNKSPEPIEVIVNWELDFLLGNVVKYISRWEDKEGIEDLKKAKFYLDKFIEKNDTISKM